MATPSDEQTDRSQATGAIYRNTHSLFRRTDPELLGCRLLGERCPLFFFKGVLFFYKRKDFLGDTETFCQNNQDKFSQKKSRHAVSEMYELIRTAIHQSGSEHYLKEQVFPQDHKDRVKTKHQLLKQRAEHAQRAQALGEKIKDTKNLNNITDVSKNLASVRASVVQSMANHCSTPKKPKSNKTNSRTTQTGNKGHPRT